MATEMKSGSVLIKDRTPVPESVQAEPYIPGWNLVRDADVAQTQENLERAGWHFFYAEPEIVGEAFTRDFKAALRRAAQHLAGKVDEQKLNAIEVTSIIATKVFGFYDVAVQGRPRHIQQNAVPVQPGLKESSSAQETRASGDRVA